MSLGAVMNDATVSGAGLYVKDLRWVEYGEFEGVDVDESHVEGKVLCNAEMQI